MALYLRWGFLIATGGSGSVYRRGGFRFTEIEAAGRAAGQNIWLTRMRSDNSGFNVGRGNVRSVAKSGSRLKIN